MTKRPGKRIRRRHLAIVFLLFAGMGALIVMAKLRAPVSLPLNEPPGITTKRLDKQNNAYYVLEEAANLLPAPPTPLVVLKDEKGFSDVYKSEDDSVGGILDIKRPDDDPLLLEYVKKSGPAIEYALQAVEKPWFLYPNDLGEDFSIRSSQSRPVWQLAAVCFAQAIIHSCSEDPREDACTFLYDAARLSSVMSQNGYAGFPSVPEAAAVIQKASPDHQRNIAEWLAQFRSEWRPPETRFDEELRKIYRMTGPPQMQKGSMLFKLVANIPINQMKKNVYLHEQDLRKAANMTYLQFDQYRKQHPDFLNPKRLNADSLYLSFCEYNSSFFATVDGLSIVVALELCRRDRGEYPETLNALVPQYLPELPKNPYDGQDFTYNRTDGAYLLHCVGGFRRGESWQPNQHFLVYASKDLRSDFWEKQAEELHAIRRQQRGKTSL